jgi:hypothetical protein
MKLSILAVAYVLLNLVSISAAQAQTSNPFNVYYNRDVYSAHYAEYDMDGFTYDLDAPGSDAMNAYRHFENTCLYVIPSEQVALLKKQQNNIHHLDVNDFQFETSIVSSKNLSNKDFRAADYVCRMKVRMNPKGFYTIRPEFSSLFKGSDSAQRSVSVIKNALANKANNMLFAAHYYVGYENRLSHQLISQAVLVKLVKNGNCPVPTTPAD